MLKIYTEDVYAGGRGLILVQSDGPVAQNGAGFGFRHSASKKHLWTTNIIHHVLFAFCDENTPIKRLVVREVEAVEGTIIPGTTSNSAVLDNFDIND